jgi:hypothetical protein
MFQPWTNAPDEVKFSGVFYGTRSIADLVTLSRGIDANPEFKSIYLVYKWKRYPGFIRNVSISADAMNPRMFRYSFDFVGRSALDLYRVMIGNLTGTTAEIDYLQSQTEGAYAALTSATGLASVAILAGEALAGGGTGKGLTAALLQRLILFAAGAAFVLGRGRGGVKKKIL